MFLMVHNISALWWLNQQFDVVSNASET